MSKKFLILGLMCVLSVSLLAGCGEDAEKKKQDQIERDLTKGLEDFKNLKPTPHKGY